MRNVRVLMLAVLLPLMAGLIAGHLTAEPAQAATNRAYYRVTHTDTGGNNVKVADGYADLPWRYSHQSLQQLPIGVHAARQFKATRLSGRLELPLTGS